MRKIILTCLSAVFALALVSGCSKDAGKDIPKDRNRAAEKPKDTKQKKKKFKLGEKRRAVLPTRTPEKQSFDKVNSRLVVRLAQNIIERNDLATMSTFAERARNSNDPGIRAAIVEALGWFEDRALPELLLFINDDNPDVATAALRLVDLHFDGVKNIRDKIALVEVALQYAPDEMIDSIVSKLDNMEPRHSFPKLMSMMDDYADDPVVLDALIRQYEFISGENFTDKSTAFKWFFATEKKRLKSRK